MKTSNNEFDKEEECWIHLINAVILQAFKDYQWASRKLERDPESLSARLLIEDVERFCHSDWLTFLTDLDGEWLWERIKEWH